LENADAINQYKPHSKECINPRKTYPNPGTNHEISHFTGDTTINSYCKSELDFQSQSQPLQEIKLVKEFSSMKMMKVKAKEILVIITPHSTNVILWIKAAIYYKITVALSAKFHAMGDISHFIQAV